VTTDERLDKLTDKVSAIAEHLDLLTRMHIDNEREFRERFDKIEDLFQRNEERFQRTEERFQRNEERLAQLMDTMNIVGRILTLHEKRLDDLEAR
jgi:hypothetical protein